MFGVTMSFFKQALISLIILALAGAAWLYLDPRAAMMLRSAGMDWLPVASAPAAPPEQGGALRRGANTVGVVTDAVGLETINDRLAALGTGRAHRSVSVTPSESGRLIEWLVEPGAFVREGQVIARLESATEEIALDRARLALRDAEARLERIRSLRASNTATNVQMEEAELALENARLSVRDAELALKRRRIEAPIAGVVGILPISAGNYVTSQSEIATIDDRSEIVIDFWVPERFAGAMSVGAPLTATAVARPGEILEGRVSAVDNRIDEASRTLRVQARIPNPDDRLRAGMSFQVTMRFPGETFPAVDPLAVQWSSDGAFVWAVRNGRAERVPVRIIQRNTDTVLVDASLEEGETVVVEGLHAVRDGAEVMIARSAGSPAPAEAAPANPAASGS
jgi:RND family efflux transporter MFP subunit